MPHGLSRRLRYVFLLQAVAASFAIVIGIYAAGVIVMDLLAGERLREEAASYWEGRARSPLHPLPETSTVSAYFLPRGGSAASLPVELRPLRPGLGELPAQKRKVLVDERPEGTLYVTMSFRFAGKVVRWVGIASTILSLLALYVVSWLTYRSSRRIVVPVSWLAREVSRWDPRDPDTAAISPERMPRHVGREVQQLGESLRGLADRVRDFVQRERDFTRDASHELRTPLTVIRVATDLMLADDGIPDRTRRSLGRIQRAGRDMEAVIDAFLILGREDAVAPQSEDFDVRDVIYEEVAKVRPLLVDKPIALTVHESASPRLHASPHVLAVMFGNLLNNACTFTVEGMIEVYIEADRVMVRDSGIGMSADTLRKAYDPFFRADQFNAAGKGMGLSIVRRLGARFGWPVTLESTPSVGTTATIRFVPEPGAAPA